MMESLSVQWMRFEPAPFSEPFFQQTLERIRQSGDRNQERATDVAVLLETSSTLPEAKPAGIIFHVSRCGSTLLTNVLRACGEVVALSEAQPIEFFLGPYPLRNSLLSKEERLEACEAMLKSIVQLYVHKSADSVQRLIVKCVPTSSFQIRWARAVWPDVPFVFLMRNPLEIISSNVNKPAHWMRSKYQRMQDNVSLGLPIRQLQEMSDEEYCARVIGNYYREAITQASRHCIFVDYTELTLQTFEAIALRFGLQLPDMGSIELNRALSTYSKDASGQRPFKGDTLSKHANATEHLRSVTAEFAEEPYKTLRRLRSAW